MIPKYHTVPYKGVAINYENGVYKIPLLPACNFLSYTDAKNHIDHLEKLIDLEKFFDKLKQANDQNGFSEKIQK